MGALTGALLTGIIMILPISYSVVKFVLFHGLVNIVMIKIGLRIRQKKAFFKACLVVYICSFLVGGIFTSIRQYIGKSSMFFAAAVISYLFALGIWEYISAMKRYEMEECEVLLCNEGKELKIKALIDTGNRLKDSLTGKSVHIISKETAMELGEEVIEKDIRYIPYHTIGKKNGVMKMFSIECMCLYLEEELWIDKPLIAISEEGFCEGKCKMILNPDVK